MLHCPMTAPLHLLLGHLGIAVVLLLGAEAWSMRRPRKLAQSPG
jgi:hypothetical protein